eukprot:CAMPEP_0176458462 /NCGR_PEP_ID=MMETSP0127-20121128/32621_1 /TAXON_ID=938130 /ORGANISM="Platyophrya macrostoma, Strain WH" /LENGTH=54 /DNA_ID=CAMNT_0017849063 /DNA_START=89 /DNA_END=250 /DNA_ORIENTATION=+
MENGSRLLSRGGRRTAGVSLSADGLRNSSSSAASNAAMEPTLAPPLPPEADVSS